MTWVWINEDTLHAAEDALLCDSRAGEFSMRAADVTREAIESHRSSGKQRVAQEWPVPALDVDTDLTVVEEGKQ